MFLVWPGGAARSGADAGTEHHRVRQRHDSGFGSGPQQQTQSQPRTGVPIASGLQRLPGTGRSAGPVSYTHLTLPTIYSV